MNSIRKKLILTVALGLSILATVIPAVAAANGQGVSGGWSESRGYYINFTSEISSESTMIASSQPDSHIGKRLTRILDSSGDVKEYAAFGATSWENVHHYTTARMELSDGTVKTTSGRQYNPKGSWSSSATSPYYLPKLFENTEARTYWGKK